MAETETMECPASADEGYALVRNLIFSQVLKFRNRYGGDVDDLMGEAHVAFMLGHQQYERGHRPSGKALETTYPAEIRRWVWFELFDAMRSRLGKRAGRRTVALGEYQPVGAVGAGMAWAMDLAPDGRLAARLVLDPPPDVAAVAYAKGGTPRNYRSTVRAHLRSVHGWEPARINAAFEEITNALG